MTDPIHRPATAQLKGRELDNEGLLAGTGSLDDAIRAASRLAVDAELLRTLLCDVCADNPQEALRVFWLLAGDSLLESAAIVCTAAADAHDLRRRRCKFPQTALQIRDRIAVLEQSGGHEAT
ncbi:MAG TPA: hypothetical protein VMT66_12225 [Steroidobacteraceae bacterium]|nr:hypothetical protein [Steroidobacteraceae bacterium]